MQLPVAGRRGLLVVVQRRTRDRRVSRVLRSLPGNRCQYLLRLKNKLKSLTCCVVAVVIRRDIALLFTATHHVSTRLVAAEAHGHG